MSNHAGTGIKRLYRSVSERKILGVCGGIAEYANVDPTIIRLAWVVLTIATGVIPGVIAYLLAALIIPDAPSSPDD